MFHQIRSKQTSSVSSSLMVAPCALPRHGERSGSTPNLTKGNFPFSRWYFAQTFLHKLLSPSTLSHATGRIISNQAPWFQPAKRFQYPSLTPDEHPYYWADFPTTSLISQSARHRHHGSRIATSRLDVAGITLPVHFAASTFCC